MGLFGYYRKKQIVKFANEFYANILSDAINGQKSKSLISELTTESLDRAKADVSKWREALEEWEDSRLPDRYEMMQLYAEIEQDDSVATHINTIMRRIDGTEFEVGTVAEDGKIQPDEEATQMLRSIWFDMITRAILEAELKGFGIIEILPSGPDGYTEDHIREVKRELLVPEWGKVRKRAQINTELIDYTSPEFRPRLMLVGHKTDKGLFNNLALLYIYKKNATAYWANYQSKFGIPPVIVKTDLTNQVKVDSLVEFMQNMRNNSFALVGYDDQLEVLNGVNADVYATFQELITHCDEQIAKVLEGQTMTSSNGSSRSQAEVHERTADHWHIARLRRIERTINSQLMPILRNDFPGKFENKIFRYKEIKDVDAIIDRAVKLKSAGFSISKDYLEELTGLPLEQIQAPTPQLPKETVEKTKAIIEAIDGLYKDIE